MNHGLSQEGTPSPEERDGELGAAPASGSPSHRACSGARPAGWPRELHPDLLGGGGGCSDVSAQGGGGLASSLSLRLGRVGDAEREMSDFDSYPFADPDLNNPFKDPSVTQVTRNVPPGLDEYNPFLDSRTPPPGNVQVSNVPSTQPAIMKPTEEHPAYTQIAKEHALAQAELLKRQEEIERKAAELDRREREMQNLSQHGRKKQLATSS
ncbi:hypothetical protein J1605_022030 [Eschrichtius robustus]|uniref:Secretory carrier-associated membrane protein n=1 Tax=Eschrichtius robustus TaxID=9764 RepID=A0AB34HBU8_ESCRO|nr:hypothetical protein J1605_022030 [Eschrichtius robustus]